ncbi:hypothetical protein TIFTF001_004385 [Ficus carica]|uniref:Uncharacterized protein n=1 Tax=Ficus carica TaxID=3494 RepID=A0AA87ZIF0_FICCA|nr:hypothetical protein TIFTF001_004385 [Ficus carica]
MADGSRKPAKSTHLTGADLADRERDRDLRTVVAEKASAAVAILCGLRRRCLGGGEEGVNTGDVRFRRWGEKRGLGGQTRLDADLGWDVRIWVELMGGGVATGVLRVARAVDRCYGRSGDTMCTWGMSADRTTKISSIDDVVGPTLC